VLPIRLEPFVIDALNQRWRLLAALLDDLLGDCICLAQSVVPRAFVLGHPAFATRALPGAAQIERYAADLVRCPDGIWRVQRHALTMFGAHPVAALLAAPGLAPFLPGLCRLLLEETLDLASTPVRSLADPAGLNLVASDADRWMITDAYDADCPPIELAALLSSQRQALQATIDAAPWRFTATMRFVPQEGPVRITLIRDD